MINRKLLQMGMQTVSVFLLVLLMVPFTGCMSIQEAAREGNIEHIKTFLALGTGIDSRTYGGDQGSALHRASGFGQVETVKFLIEKGANVNIGNEASQTPLCYAAGSGHAEIVKVLLENGAYVKGYGDKIPLNDAAGSGHVEVAEILLAYGADINRTGGNEWTALGIAVSAQQVEMVKYLILKGADVNAIASYDWTPLFSACYNNDVEIGRILLKHGADPNVGEKIPKSFIDKLRE